ncbi:MAG: DNA-3-methyladenine glycosylase I [Nitrospirae bacterium]|nr:DNA-3-methyladenine glycosylase I [Nitrospirota bacterium]MBI3595388.1 DNA-3-methyladenine glycosylase I [Nitrospirota bacterium]
MVRYHDTEWGVSVYDDRRLFEFLILEGAQAGLSWMTILKRREGYREAFDQFNAKKVSSFDSKKIEDLLNNPKIIRNRLKISSAVNNARCFLEIIEEFGSFSRYQWEFVGGKPIQNRRKSTQDFPVTTRESDAFSGDLKKRGFKFVGSTIIYAHMQAVGMVNDHTISCFRHQEVQD